MIERFAAARIMDEPSHPIGHPPCPPPSAAAAARPRSIEPLRSRSAGGPTRSKVRASQRGSTSGRSRRPVKAVGTAAGTVAPTKAHRDEAVPPNLAECGCLTRGREPRRDCPVFVDAAVSSAPQEQLNHDRIGSDALAALSRSNHYFGDGPESVPMSSKL